MVVIVLTILARLLMIGSPIGGEMPAVEFIQPSIPADELAELEEWADWMLYHQEARAEYENEFDAIFNALSVTSKRTDKGIRVTVRRPNGKLARSYTVKGK